MQLDCARFVSTTPALATGDRLLKLYSGMSAGSRIRACIAFVPLF
jgi:hypothetical protein